MTATITRLEAGYFRPPLPFTMADARHGEMTAFDLVTVHITDSDGAEGVGYTYSLNGGGAICDLIRRDMAAQVIGADAGLIEDLWQRLWWHVHYVGRGGAASFALSAIDIALWDLKARKAGLPLWRLLGGHDPRVPAYAGSINLNFTIDQLIEQNQDLLARGFKAVKMRVGRPGAREDAERVKALRDLVGPDIAIMVDANMKFSVDEAIRRARAFQPYDLTWLEEPTIPDDVAGHARILRDGGVPIAAGENFHTLYEFQKMIVGQGVSFIEPDITNCGGVTGLIKVAHLAEAFNLPVTTHGVHDLQVHVLAAISNAAFLEIHGFAIDPYIDGALVLEDGLAIAPERPGHGLTFDWPSLEPHRA